MDESADPTEDERSGASPASELTGDSVVSRRRRFLVALSAPPIAAALAGCPIPDEGTAGDGETPPARVDLREMDAGDAAPFGGIVRFADAYEMEATASGANTSEIHTSGRFDGDSHALHVETDDASFESYVVDGDAYQVRDGDCVRYPGVADGVQAETTTDDAAAGARNPELTRTGTTTIDGAEAAILELPAGELEAYDDPLTYYVDVETGYLRRLEGGFGTVEYASWGDVEAIEPPDDCRDAE